MSRHSSFTFSLLFCLSALLFTLPAWSAVVTKSDGTVTIMQNGVQSTGAENVGGTLPPGTIVTTGENGKTLLEVAPGITIELQPNTQITVGETVPDKGIDALGNPIPEVYMTLAVGSIICDTQGAGGAAAIDPKIASSIRLPFGVDWNSATPEQIREAVLAAVKKNPDAAPDIVRAAIQNVRQTGRFPASGAGDAKQTVDDGTTSLQEIANMIGEAATEGNPAMAADIAQAVAGAVSATAGAMSTSLVIQTARGTISPVTAGVMVISSTGADPTMATVTVAALVGDKLAVTTEGEQVPVGEGLVVILRPDGTETGSLTDYPNLSGNVPIPPAPPVPLPPPDQPTPTPTPNPTPNPTPTPTPPPVSP